jgi:anaerobic ribonucleoside-triphosphate reductase activating protein
MNTKDVINIRYAQIRSMDVSNGESVGCALFVQGCHFHCKNCFNSETWDFNGGKEWTPEVEEGFIKLIDRPYIKRISLLGGEPLADENVSDVLKLVNKIRILFPQKTIWLYTGYTWEAIFNPVVMDDVNPERDMAILKRQCIVSTCDVLVDGRFEEDKRNLTLKFRGSSNQRLIDIQETLRKGEIVLWK